jgi:hypothetical protein
VDCDWFSGRKWEQVNLLEDEVTARTRGKMKVTRGSGLPEKSGEIIDEREGAVPWAQEMQ